MVEVKKSQTRISSPEKMKGPDCVGGEGYKLSGNSYPIKKSSSGYSQNTRLRSQ